jgi:nitrite reductase/ring-hydroxylating ferredoxin subunit
MIEVSRYERTLRAGVARLIENALDWEHLPHLHAGSFSSISLVSADDEGWTADATLAGGGEIRLNLRLDPDRAGWITTTTQGDTAASRIESRCAPLGIDRCHVAVRFFVPAEAASAFPGIGAYYEALYERLYDEDEAMMMARHEAIQAGAAGLAARRAVTLADGTETVMPLACPHLGLPLSAEPDAHGIVTCPWHGYRFDVRSGRCVSGQSCFWTV